MALRRTSSSNSESNPEIASRNRKVSFPLAALFQSVVQDGDPEEIMKILKHKDYSPSCGGAAINVNETNHVGLTPLHHCVLNNNMDSVKIMLNHGATVNSRDINGFSPLHTASAAGFVQVASMLICFGADVFERTNDGDLPIDLAKDAATSQLFNAVMIEQLHRKLMFSGLTKYYSLEAFSFIKQTVSYIIRLLMRTWIYFNAKLQQWLSRETIINCDDYKSNINLPQKPFVSHSIKEDETNESPTKNGSVS
ncbi:unnamed protein product [Owenia fusiformis]|uniref:Uncharacterized protein n=1 Tax=Owenia fusiformis TaxID=6347 RepID=A0A8J1Y562_OWEFU|nr:unnamed protein product [Owenia fusiformis]